jgi:hypothetical protein
MKIYMLRLIVSAVVIAVVAIKLILHLKDTLVRKFREGFSFKDNLCYANSIGVQSCGPGAKETVCRCKDNNLGMKIAGYQNDCMCPQSTFPNFY